MPKKSRTNALAKMALDRSLELNRRLGQGAVNSADWLFKRDTLIQSGLTPFELIHDGDLMSVRYYGLPEGGEISLADGSTLPIERNEHAVPLVLVPPLGVNADTFDLLPHRSLVRYMAASGFRTYLVDWGKPEKRHADLGLADYSCRMMKTALKQIRGHAATEELSMMGWCMGGLFCLLYQGQEQDPNIRNIITVASPIDLESGGTLLRAMSGAARALNTPTQWVRNNANLRESGTDTSRLHIPPWLTTAMFKMTDPLSGVNSYRDLIANIWDREFVVSHSTTSDYLNNMLMYPGGVLKDVASSTMSGHHFGSGRVEFGDTVADLTAIKSNLLAYAGTDDALVPPDVCRAIVDLVASEDKEFREAPGGHMGVILGSSAQNAVWAESADWLADRSSP